MSTLTRLRPWLLTMLCIVVLGVRMGGAHLHLCFDGGEPRISLHGPDTRLHHAGPEAGLAHNDQDVDLASNALTKSTKVKIDLPVLLIAAVILFGLLSGRGSAPAPYAGRLVPSIARFLRPPLRGPPQHLSM